MDDPELNEGARDNSGAQVAKQVHAGQAAILRPKWHAPQFSILANGWTVVGAGTSGSITDGVRPGSAS